MMSKSEMNKSAIEIQLKTFLGYYYYYWFYRQPASFTFNGTVFPYFYHKYNATWRTERIVEVPIILDWMKRFEGKNILEVGNVLSHYIPIQHTVIDKYEKAPNVINSDIVGFQPGCKYDLIVSISTLEHVGFDETPQEGTKILHAWENLYGLLNVNGTLVVTLPIGYNSKLDQFLHLNQMPFTHKKYLKRLTKSNKWGEVAWQDIQDARYGHPFPGANGLVIGTREKH